MKKKSTMATPGAETADRVRHVIADHLGVDFEEVTPDAGLVDDLGADELDLVELSIGLEEEFGLELNDDDAEEVFDPAGGRAHGEGTVKAVVALVERRLGSKT